MTVDCLPVTGVPSLPLVLVAALSTLAGAVVVAMARRGGGRRTPTAMIALVVAAGCLGGGLSLVGAAPARAATGQDPCVERPAAPPSTPTGTPTGTPTPQPTPTPTPDPTPTPQPTPTPTPEPTLPDYAVSFADQTVPVPPAGTVVDGVLELPEFAEQIIFTLGNVGVVDGTDPVVLFVPDEPSGYWTPVGLLDLDGTPVAGAVLTAAPGGTRIEIATPPAVGASSTLQIVLQYNLDAWDRTLVEQPDGSLSTTARPASTLIVRIADETPDGNPANDTAAFDIPGYGYLIAAP